MSLFLKRDTKVYLEKARTNGTVIWEIPVMDGFSFSQANTSSETVLNEMATPAGISKRGRRQFNDALAPAEWSMTTYVRPFRSAGTGAGAADDTATFHHAIEEALWANFVGLGTPGQITTNYNFELLNITSDATDTNITFAGSNRIQLGIFDLYFVMGAPYDNDTNFDTPADDEVLVYRITDCVVNEATISFDVDGIAMIEWSGMGSLLAKVSSFNASAAIREDISLSDNFIRNKLTSLTMLAANTTTYPGAATNGVYNITLTGGSITFTNNINFLTPEVLGVVNKPIGHITGNKSITGNFTAYLEEAVAGGSGQLLSDGLADVNTITNSFALTFTLGGTGNTPRMEISLPTAHIELPVIQTDDVIAVDVSFHGLPSTITANDEAVLTYVGAT